MTDSKPNGNGNGRNGAFFAKVGQWALAAALGAGGGLGGSYGLRHGNADEINELRKEVSRLSDTGQMAAVRAEVETLKREVTLNRADIDLIKKLAAERGPMFEEWREYLRESRRQRGTR